MKDLQTKLERAARNAARWEGNLHRAAIDYAHEWTHSRDSASELAALIAAAKGMTNANHQLSRCQKHLREYDAEQTRPRLAQ